jgi:hypothetical protein
MPRSVVVNALLSAALAASVAASMAACGGTPAPDSAAKPPAPAAPPKDDTPQLGAVVSGASRPMSPWATRPVAVYPLQRIAPADSAGWASAIPDVSAAMQAFDDELRFALTQRRGLSEWKQLPDLERAARRAVPFSPVLRDLPVEALVGKLDERLRSVPGSLAESIRKISGLTDVRWALVPAQVKFVPAAGGQRAVVRVLLIDARTGEIGFAADVLGEVAPAWAPVVLASVAQRVADQFVAP